MIRTGKNHLIDTWSRWRGIPIERDLTGLRVIMTRIEEYDWTLRSDREIREVATRIRQQARQGKALEDLQPEAYSLVCEAARRTVRLDPHGVQILAGIAMHRGKLVEMNTGEGKTLAAVFPMLP